MLTDWLGVNVPSCAQKYQASMRNKNDRQHCRKGRWWRDNILYVDLPLNLKVRGSDPEFSDIVLQWCRSMCTTTTTIWTGTMTLKWQNNFSIEERCWPYLPAWSQRSQITFFHPNLPYSLNWLQNKKDTLCLKAYPTSPPTILLEKISLKSFASLTELLFLTSCPEMTCSEVVSFWSVAKVHPRDGCIPLMEDVAQRSFESVPVTFGLFTWEMP